MAISTELLNRSNSQCELCSAATELVSLTVSPKTGEEAQDQIAICGICHDQIQNQDDLNPNHWRCLNESMWSEVPAVKVMAYRLLNQLTKEGWAQDLIGMLYLDDETMEWAQYNEAESDAPVVHIDSNGNVLEAGDTVTLIQDLNVKGTSLTAKRGTAVRRIRLVHDNAEHIEGKVEGQTIVILTKFVKKS